MFVQLLQVGSFWGEVSSIVCEAVGAINAPPEQRMEPFNPCGNQRARHPGVVQL